MITLKHAIKTAAALFFSPLGTTIVVCVALGVFSRWTPLLIEGLSAQSKVYNPMAIRESGIGRTICRLLTDQAEFAFHFGSSYPVRGTAYSFLSAWVQKINASATKIVRKTPPTAGEAAAALHRTQSLLETTFNLDPSYYPAYSIYFGFLTDGSSTPHSPWAGIENMAGKSDSTGVNGLGQQDGNLKIALDITRRALTSYNTKDPEQSAAAALAIYNQYVLLAPIAKLQGQETFLRQKAHDEMAGLLSNAQTVVEQQKRAGIWQRRSQARRDDYSAAYILAKKICDTLIEKNIKEPLPKNTDAR